MMGWDREEGEASLDEEERVLIEYYSTHPSTPKEGRTLVKMSWKKKTNSTTGSLETTGPDTSLMKSMLMRQKLTLLTVGKTAG